MIADQLRQNWSTLHILSNISLPKAFRRSSPGRLMKARDCLNKYVSDP